MHRITLTVAGLVALSALLVGASPSKPAKALTVTEIARQSKTAVGLIVTSDASGKLLASGSCFFIHADGTFVTNYHVIRGAKSAIVKLPNGAFYEVEGVLIADEAKDLALLRASGSDFSTLRIGNSDSVEVGEKVVAIGNPEELEYTVSDGIVSAIRRMGDDRVRFFQITAPISHGSSGGPLLNARGEVIGVTTLMHVQAQNANFAVAAGYLPPLLRHAGLNPVPIDWVGLVMSDVVSVDRSDRAKSSGPPPLTEHWVSLQSGADFRLLRDEDFLYVEYLAPESESPFLCELKTEGLNSWAGVCRWRYEADCRGKQMSCKLERESNFRLVSANRMEGTISMPTLDCKKPCRVTSARRHSFTLIPKE